MWLPTARNLACLSSNHLHLHTFYLCTLNANNPLPTKKLFNLFQHLKVVVAAFRASYFAADFN